MTSKTESPAPDMDRKIGAAIARERQARGWSQQDLAAKMVGLRWNWTQQMVAKVEKGLRPVRFAEAGDLAQIFKVSTQTLLFGPLEAAVQNVRRQRTQARDVLATTMTRAQVLEAMFAASTGAEMSLPSPPLNLAIAFRVPDHDWQETLGILRELGATENDLTPLMDFVAGAHANVESVLPYGEALWELVSRLLPSLTADG